MKKGWWLSITAVLFSLFITEKVLVGNHYFKKSMNAYNTSRMYVRWNRMDKADSFMNVGNYYRHKLEGMKHWYKLW